MRQTFVEHKGLLIVTVTKYAEISWRRFCSAVRVIG